MTIQSRHVSWWHLRQYNPNSCVGCLLQRSSTGMATALSAVLGFVVTQPMGPVGGGHCRILSNRFTISFKRLMWKAVLRSLTSPGIEVAARHWGQEMVLFLLLAARLSKHGDLQKTWPHDSTLGSWRVSKQSEQVISLWRSAQVARKCSAIFS